MGTAQQEISASAIDAIEAVKIFPGRTNAELAGESGIDRRLLARLLPTAADKDNPLIIRGEARYSPSIPDARKCTTWWPAA